MSEALLTLSGIRFTYPGADQPVLDGLDFTFTADQRMGLFGPNGSGKTTLLHVMLGLLKPDAGEIRHKGQALVGGRDFQALRLSLGLLLQHADDQIIYPTVLDDVAFGPLNRGLTERQAREKAEWALELLGLAGFAERLAHRLSGGEKKLVSLAGVLAMEPDALVLDEPTNGLDPDTRERLVDILAKLDKPMIVVSHDWDFLVRVTRTFHSIENGRLVVNPEFVPHRHVHLHPLGNLHHHHHGGEFEVVEHKRLIQGYQPVARKTSTGA
ncbi:MAG: ABC transporter ATP-binding protein [Pseudomonadota bacterium]